MSTLPQDGLIAIVKRDCPTCVLAAPVLGELARARGLKVYTQDDPAFPETVPEPIDDTALDISHHLKIEVVPTLIRLENGREVARTYGWDRGEWERLSGLAGLGSRYEATDRQGQETFLIYISLIQPDFMTYSRSHNLSNTTFRSSTNGICKK